jgi:hypothetical protein
MEINVAKRREIEHPLRDDATVAHYDDGVGLDICELSAEFLIGLDALGLSDGEIQFRGGLFDGRLDEFKAAAFRTVGLGYDEMDTMAGGGERLQRGNSEARSAAEDEREGHWVIW